MNFPNIFRLAAIYTWAPAFKEIGFKTFKSLFYSVLDYCSGVWGFDNFSCVDNVQNRALRYFLGLHRFTPHLALSGEVGWLPSTERRWLNMFRLWNRLIRMEDSRLTKKVFYWDYSMQGVWCSQIDSLCEMLGINHVFLNLLTLNIKEIERKLFEYTENLWLERLTTFPKLRTYTKFKNKYTLENYVLSPTLSKQERSAFAQFRCGILPIRVETGRFRNEHLHERVCIFCENNCIEDEEHFLVKCPLYSNLRKKYFHMFGSEHFDNNRYLFITLVNDYPIQTAKFVNSAFNLRKEMLHK